jgi:hypothetical protein
MLERMMTMLAQDMCGAVSAMNCFQVLVPNFRGFFSFERPQKTFFFTLSLVMYLEVMIVYRQLILAKLRTTLGVFHNPVFGHFVLCAHQFWRPRQTVVDIAVGVDCLCRIR